MRGMGADHPEDRRGVDRRTEWQIEGLRRLEIPEDMQTKHGSGRGYVVRG